MELVSYVGLHSFYYDVIHGKPLSDMSGTPVAGAAQLANQRMKKWLVEMKVVSGDVAEWADEWQAVHLFSGRRARNPHHNSIRQADL